MPRLGVPMPLSSNLIDLPDIPPAVWLLLTEVVRSTSWQDSRKRIKSILPVLRDQSENFFVDSAKRLNYDRNPTKLDFHMHGSLDLLAGHGCMDFKCRMQAADRLARSVGLIADRVWLSDTLSDRFLDFGRVTNAKLDEVIADVFVLMRLLPLIQAGIVRFTSQVMPACPDCITKFDAQVESITEELFRIFKRDFRLQQRGSGGYSVNTGKCFEPPLVMVSRANDLAEIPSTRSYAEFAIKKEVSSIMWVAREASLSKGSILSNSRLGLSGLLQQEGRLIDRRGLLFLDKEREFSVPWVSDLDALQIVQLREEASTALPAFRLSLAKAMSFPDSTFEGRESLGSIIEELQDQAQQVRSELELQQTSSTRYWKTTYALLGLGLSAYGVASDQLPAAIGGLLHVINLLIGHKTGHETEVARLTTRPGYVLVKARDLLEHAH